MNSVSSGVETTDASSSHLILQLDNSPSCETSLLRKLLLLLLPDEFTASCPNGISYGKLIPFRAREDIRYDTGTGRVRETRRRGCARGRRKRGEKGSTVVWHSREDAHTLGWNYSALFRCEIGSRNWTNSRVYFVAVCYIFKQVDFHFVLFILFYLGRQCLVTSFVYLRERERKIYRLQ